MKEETKIDGYDFFEHGALVEERQRTDIYGFQEAIINGASITDLFMQYPHLTLNSFNKITAIQQELLKEQYKNTVRNLHVTYIYGKADAGKTTYPTRVLGFKPMEICKIADYGSGKFDEYSNQDIVLFDEFRGLFAAHTRDYLYARTQPLYLAERATDRASP